MSLSKQRDLVMDREAWCTTVHVVVKSQILSLSTAPWKESNDKPRRHIKKQRHYFANKGPYSQSYSFSSSHVWMWELDHKVWALKNWCSWFVVLEKTFEIPWRAGRSNKSILKEINPGYSLEELRLKLKLRQRTDSLEKTLMLREIEGRRRGRKRTRWLDGITDSIDMSLSKL